MQYLDVISLNIWGVVISLLNLVVLFLILKKFLFKPVKKTLDERISAVDEKYSAAAQAVEEAEKTRNSLNERLESAQDEADAIVADARERAKANEQKMLTEAKEKADGIVRAAQSEAEAERRAAQDDIRTQIAGVSAAIAEKLLEREINSDDQDKMIDEFIDAVGDIK